MATNSDKILPGYPQPVGSKIESVTDHYGPTLYSQTTGDVYLAANQQQGGFDKVEAGTSFNPMTGVQGNYTVQVYYPTSDAGIGASSVKLVWYTNGGGQVANGTNLNNEVTRLHLLMY